MNYQSFYHTFFKMFSKKSGISDTEYDSPGNSNLFMPFLS